MVSAPYSVMISGLPYFGFPPAQLVLELLLGGCEVAR